MLGLEVTRLARNNVDWYRLLDLCGLTDTLIGDSDGLYHPALYNDRLLLGLKGNMSEAELHVLKGRLAEAIRAKAARGELRCALPVGYVWGREEGQVLCDPDDEIVGAVRSVFERFAALGSARRVWLWFLEQGLQFPVRAHPGADIAWLPPSEAGIRRLLHNAVYAGAYVFGKTRAERYVQPDGTVSQRVVRLPQEKWRVLLRDHHEGYIDWARYEANRARLAANRRPRAGGVGGAVREGRGLLQGIAVCGQCGRRVQVRYRSKTAPTYHCAGAVPQDGRARQCFGIGGVLMDRAVSAALLEALRPAGMEAALRAAEELEQGREAALEPWRLALERAGREAEQAGSDFDLINKKNRRVAAKYETELEERLAELERVQAELERRQQRRPVQLDAQQREAVLALGEDVARVWDAPTTTARDRKELLRALLPEVVVCAPAGQPLARLELHWQGGQVTELEVERSPGRGMGPPRTAEDTVDLLRRLAAHHSDAVIATVLNRQGRTTARGLPFTRSRVSSLRQYRKIPCYQPPAQAGQGEPLSVQQAARELGMAPSTVHRWINDGFLPAEQVTPGAPWRIRLTPELRSRLVEEPPPGYLRMRDAMPRLGVSRQTVLQWVKQGKLEAVMVYRGRRKGLAIKILEDDSSLFKQQG